MLLSCREICYLQRARRFFSVGELPTDSPNLVLVAGSLKLEKPTRC